MNLEEIFSEETLQLIGAYLIQGGINVVLAAVILIIGMMVAGMVRRWIRGLADKNESVDQTLGQFFASLAYYGLMALVWIAVLGQFGVQTTSLVAAMGAAALAVGLALQGTLSNIAAGVMLILFRPYKIGDFIEAAGASGTVTDITLFTTVLSAVDNRRIFLPNAEVWGSTIINVSVEPTRRLVHTYSIDYGDDIDKAIDVITKVFEADERVLKDQEIMVAVAAHGASSVDLTARAWVNQADYWPLHFAMLKAVKEAFDREGLTIPYPHQVEIHKQG